VIPVDLPVDLDPSTIDGLAHVHADVDPDSGEVAIRWIYSEAQGRNILGEVSAKDLEWIRRDLIKEAIEFREAICSARAAGFVPRLARAEQMARDEARAEQWAQERAEQLALKAGGWES
jgi:hypothetical protein